MHPWFPSNRGNQFHFYSENRRIRELSGRVLFLDSDGCTYDRGVVPPGVIKRAPHFKNCLAVLLEIASNSKHQDEV